MCEADRPRTRPLLLSLAAAALLGAVTGLITWSTSRSASGAVPAGIMTFLNATVVILTAIRFATEPGDVPPSARSTREPTPPGSVRTGR